MPIITGKSFVKDGDDVSFKCEYRGSQSIAWYKDDTKIINVGNKGKVKNSKYQRLTLSLKNVTSNAEGEYKCGAKFDDNNIANTSIKLDVFGKFFSLC